MRYLLLTSVPAYAGQSDGVIRVTESWHNELLAQTAALAAAGFDVTVATPLHAGLDADTLVAHRIVEIEPTKLDFAYAALPEYRTMSQFVAARAALRERIGRLAAEADVVQMGPGGHPFALGQVAWPVVKRLGRKTVFSFSTDPFPALARYASGGRNPAKRLAKSMAVGRLEHFCRRVISAADVVFAHDDAVVERFRAQWSPKCHLMHPSGLLDADLALPETLDLREGRLHDKTQPLRVFCLGGAQLTRGVDHLLRAVAKARRLGAKIVVDLFGDLTQSADLMDVLRAEKCESAVRLRGLPSIELLRPAMDECDLVAAAALVPGVDQGLELAMARGLGVVTYQRGASDRDLQSTNAAVVLPRGETNELAQTLLDLSNDRPRVAALGRAASTHAAAVTLDAVHRRRARLVKEAVGAS
jgi:glycosyltransferase involved in cell wall biosynthesis